MQSTKAEQVELSFRLGMETDGPRWKSHDLWGFRIMQKFAVMAAIRHMIQPCVREMSRFCD